MNGDIKQGKDETDSQYLKRLAQRGVAERETLSSDIKNCNDKLDLHRDLIDENKERSNKNATWLNVVVSSLGIAGATLFGAIIPSTILQSNESKRRIQSVPSKKTISVLKQVEGKNYDDLIREIKNGKYDQHLQKIEDWERANQNRISVLRAIEERKHKIRK